MDKDLTCLNIRKDMVDGRQDPSSRTRQTLNDNNNDDETLKVFGQSFGKFKATIFKVWSCKVHKTQLLHEV